jgi:hypothetical protein
MTARKLQLSSARIDHAAVCISHSLMGAKLTVIRKFMGNSCHVHSSPQNRRTGINGVSHCLP